MEHSESSIKNESTSIQKKYQRLAKFRDRKRQDYERTAWHHRVNKTEHTGALRDIWRELAYAEMRGTDEPDSQREINRAFDIFSDALALLIQAFFKSLLTPFFVISKILELITTPENKPEPPENTPLSIEHGASICTFKPSLKLYA
ncbi:hypothetical protein [Vibrio alfacsensis]|uniref:hypothetical protein n=2 Tax=Vibrio TaxID=662 RepID=UPI004068BC0F